MKKTVAIIGGGPASMMLASFLDQNKFDVTIYEKNAAPGRKFLVAGDGGFNLTHSEPEEQLVSRYIPAPLFTKVISAFNNADLRKWLQERGIETFVGSSGRVFPVKDIKPVDVLNAILNDLRNKNVVILPKHTWEGWSQNNELLFRTADGRPSVKPDITVFGLGGASWPVTGSSGEWLRYFEEKGIAVSPFEASNAATLVAWPEEVIRNAEGQILKNISVSCGPLRKNGELVITSKGLEGGAVYALASCIRNEVKDHGKATIYLDLKPAFTIGQVLEKFSKRGNRSVSKLLEDKLSFTKTQITLLKSFITKEQFTELPLLAKLIKDLPVIVTGLAPLDEAISSVRGVSLEAVTEEFELKKMPGVYCIGEMLDWDAPTGGYLLQGCFSMGKFLADILNK